MYIKVITCSPILGKFTLDFQCGQVQNECDPMINLTDPFNTCLYFSRKLCGSLPFSLHFTEPKVNLHLFLGRKTLLYFRFNTTQKKWTQNLKTTIQWLKCLINKKNFNARNTKNILKRERVRLTA